jgi:hypothetical protein
MAEENQNEEQNTFKIADRRKFNVDGSLREGVTIEAPKPKTEEKPLVTAAQSAPNVAAADSADVFESPVMDMTGFADEEPVPEEDEIDTASIPGAENPASFANFLLSLASQAAAAMGLAENPMTGRRSADLELSRYWLDVLGMLREKTKGNLHPQEQKLFDGLLGDLRMQFVQLARAAEAQLKQKAAQKFSGKDILGK